jgi:hypothetical protein
LLVFDARPFRIDRTLSDYKGRDPFIHHNRVAGIINCLGDAFGTRATHSAIEIRRALFPLRRSATSLKHDSKADSLFRPALFRSLVETAIDIAIQRGFIPAV